MPPYGDNPSAPPMDSGADSSASDPSQEGGDTFFLPPGAAKYAEGLKKGDEIIFKVVNIDDKGEVEVTYAKPEGEGDEGNFTDGLEEHMNGGGESANPDPSNY